jgi:hypothetical protein
MQSVTYVPSPCAVGACVLPTSPASPVSAPPPVLPPQTQTYQPPQPRQSQRIPIQPSALQPRASTHYDPERMLSVFSAFDPHLRLPSAHDDVDISTFGNSASLLYCLCWVFAFDDSQLLPFRRCVWISGRSCRTLLSRRTTYVITLSQCFHGTRVEYFILIGHPFSR